MEGRGGCCIARYATGGAYYDMCEWDKIMLRFRPIAPKPVAGKSPTASGGSSSEGNDAVRTKRKYARSVKDNNNNKRQIRRRNTTSSPEKQNHAPVVTLPLLPETPDLKDLTIPETKKVQNNTNKNMPAWNLSHAKIETELKPFWYYGTTVSYSCVTVESVTDTWQEGESLGSTDEDRRVNLSKDTCPGFISDGYGRVTWTNRAYRETVGEGACVLLGMKKNVSVAVTNPLSFTCKVSVVCYDTCGKERRSLMLPCDVWSMDFGGFAWRLDLKAALSLSLAP
ncbi:hypothetical protein TanjilG_06446 [Lupinus angustifolius]|uniref:DUF7950 domain-containing protein n=2 Tax=Lupinus angustifolius TaxID=3871 RepID=A0A1J7IGH4_LUPAN|nr:hypothetical protein TanjilG_06446 [Lupinus angustifolius]